MSWERSYARGRRATADEHEDRTHLRETMLGLGWRCIGWTHAGFPNLFTDHPVARKSDLCREKCWLIQKSVQGKWALRGCLGREMFWLPVRNLPLLRDTTVRFSTPAGVAAWAALIKPELPR